MPSPEQSGYPPPPQRVYENEYYDSGDEYPSDEELDDADVDVLNTDYSLQRDLTFFPAHQPPRNRHNPSVPPRLKKDNESHDPEKDAFDPRQPLQRPPRYSSLQKEKMYDGDSDYGLPHHNAPAYQYPQYRKRRPLVDLIRNEWQQTASSHPSSPGYSTPSWFQVLTAPRIRRYVYVLLLLFTFVWGPWHYWGQAAWDEDRLLTASLDERMRTGEGWFGENIRPEFLDMVQVKTLDTDLIPASGDRKRLIVVGDVHGCKDERRP